MNSPEPILQPRHLPKRMATADNFVGTWLRSFFVLFVLCLAWNLATPLGGAPDEPAQVVKAAATVHGQLIGQPAPGQVEAERIFQVPAVFKSIFSLPECFQFKPTVPAGCAPKLRAGSRLVTVESYVGRYPPLYYAIVGLPSLVMHSENVIYAMRVVSALLDALLLGLALAVAVTWCRSSMLLGALGLTLTPLVFFYAGVVNPSGFEMAAAICLWTTGLALVRHPFRTPPRRLVTIFVVVGSLLALTRGLSVLWLALIVVTLLCLEPTSCRELIRQRRVRIGALLLGLVSVIALGFVVVARTLAVVPSSEKLPHHASFIQVVEVVLGDLRGYLGQLIGLFGWLDTPSPLLTMTLWIASFGFLILLALVVSKPHESRALLGLIGGSFLLTLFLILVHSGTSGITWQARDGFPLYAGIPLVAGAILPRNGPFALGSPTGRRATVIVALVVLVAQLTDFVWALRRNTIGLGSKVNLFHPARHGWSPPLGTPVLVIVGTVAVVLYAGWLFRLLGMRDSLVAASPGRTAGLPA